MGSSHSTSREAAAILPLFNASARSCSLTIAPRAVLTNTALLFISDKASELIIPKVLSVSGQCIVSTSALERASSKDTFSYGQFKGFDLVFTKTFIPKAAPIPATFLPILPKPITDNVFPAIS